MTKSLIVQMGHCYRTTGATGTNGEQQFATQVGAAAVRLLDGKNGWRVRAVLADIPVSQYGGDAFVAVHCDGSTSATAHGASVGYQNNEGRAVALAWKRAYAARGWSRGFRADNYTPSLGGYYGVRNARSAGNQRAFIVECGFLTNPADRALLTGAGGPERVALAIGDALGITANPQEDDDMTAKELLDARFGHDALTAFEPWAKKPGTIGHALRNLMQDSDALRNYVDTVEAQLAETRSGLATANAKLDQLIAALSQ